MARERFIRGKKDSAKHDGLYSNTKRLQAADHHLKEYLSGAFDAEIGVAKTPKSNIELEMKWSVTQGHIS